MQVFYCAYAGRLFYRSRYLKVNYENSVNSLLPSGGQASTTPRVSPARVFIHSPGPTHLWSKKHQARCLIKQPRFINKIKLYDVITRKRASWLGSASEKRLQMRIRARQNCACTPCQQHAKTIQVSDWCFVRAPCRTQRRAGHHPARRYAQYHPSTPFIAGTLQ